MRRAGIWMSNGTKMIVYLLFSLVSSGCMDLSDLGKPWPAANSAAIAPLPPIAAKLTGTWEVDPANPSDLKREFLFIPKRYTGAHSSRANEMFGFAACWEHLKDGKPTGDGFWGETADRPGDFVMYIHESSIVYSKLATVKVDGNRATISFKDGKLNLHKTSPDTRNDTEKEVLNPKP